MRLARKVVSVGPRISSLCDDNSNMRQWPGTPRISTTARLGCSTSGRSTKRELALARKLGAEYRSHTHTKISSNATMWIGRQLRTLLRLDATHDVVERSIFDAHCASPVVGCPVVWSSPFFSHEFGYRRCTAGAEFFRGAATFPLGISVMQERLRTGRVARQGPRQVQIRDASPGIQVAHGTEEGAAPGEMWRVRLRTSRSWA